MSENIRSINRSALTQRQNSVVSVSMELLQSTGTETTFRTLCMHKKCICHKNADEKRKNNKNKERLEKEKRGKMKGNELR